MRDIVPTPWAISLVIRLANERDALNETVGATINVADLLYRSPWLEALFWTLYIS